MGFSRRKPYHYLKDAHSSFMRRHVRWLRDIYTRESFLEKPYLAEGRAEMHMEMPSFIFPLFPPYPKWRIPPPPSFPPIPIPPPILLPPPKGFPPIDYPPSIPPFKPSPPRGIGPPRALPPPVHPPGWPPPKPRSPYPPPAGTVPPGDSPGGIRIKPQCSVDATCSDCAEKGDLCIVTAQLQYFSSLDPGWVILSSNPAVVNATLLETWSGQATFLIEVLEDIDPEIPVSVCIYVRTKKTGFKKELIIDCGCFEFIACCPAEPNISWDDAGSDETIVRNGSANVAVLGGQAPFTWSVTGTGFSFATPVTSGRTNVLSADNTACGSATITVVDGCGQSTVGYVREEDNSQWGVIAGNVCLLSGAASWSSYGIQPWKLDGEIIRGKYKSVVRMGGAFGANGCITCGSPKFPAASTCSEYCASANCLQPIGCAECMIGFAPANYTKAGPWNCFGLNGTECEGGWTNMLCGCVSQIFNWEWICN